MLLLGGAAGVWFWGPSLPALQQVILWGALLALAAVLMRRGWLKLFGPVLFYDMVRAARRGRYFALRAGYAALLLFVLFAAYLNTDRNGTMRQQAARFANNYFQAFMLVQIIVMSLLTPAYVAGAVADEKVRRTLEFLLATDLRNREVVLSKLLSRLANLGLFLLTGLPIISLIQFLGGVDPNLVLGGFAATGLMVLGLAGWSIYMSVAFRRPRDAIVMTYLAAVAYLAVSFFTQAAIKNNLAFIHAPIWFGSSSSTIGDALDIFNSSNLVTLVQEVRAGGEQGTLDVVIPQRLGKMALFNGLAFLTCITLAVLRLRRVALRQMFGRSRRPSTIRPIVPRPRVGDHPLLWKELFVETRIRFTWLGYILVLILVVVSLAPGAWMVFKWLVEPAIPGRWEDGGIEQDMNHYVRLAGMAVGSLLLLAVAVRASTAIRSERDRQTFDSLLTTPLGSDTILWAKWLGSVLCVRWGWLWVGMIWGMGIFSGGMHALALPLLVGAWLIFAGIFAVIGLWFSMIAKSVMRATVWTLITILGLSLGHWLLWLICLPLMWGSPGQAGTRETVIKFQIGLTPPLDLVVFSFSEEDFRHDYQRNEMADLIAASAAGLFVWMLAGLFFWMGIVSPWFRALTKRGKMMAPERRGKLPVILIEDKNARPPEVILLDGEQSP